MDTKQEEQYYQEEPAYSEIVVKFKEGGTLEVGDDGRLYAKHLNLDRFYQILESSGAEARRSFRASTSTLRRLNARASERLGRQLPNLDLYVRVRPRDLGDIEELFSQLAEDPDLKEIIEQITLAQPPGPPPSPHFTDLQGYLKEASLGGVDAFCSWLSHGGAGDDVRVCDFEFGFNSHEDLPKPDVIYNPDGDLTQKAKHGTSVLGILAGKKDEQGVTGICHRATILFASESGPDTPDANRLNCINAILEEVDQGSKLRSGDVLLLEAQTSRNAPAEYNNDFRNAVATLVGNDIVVVAAAGNAGRDLKIISSIWNPASPNHDDSGAILVGAGRSIQHPHPHSKAPYSCYGSRVDCQGWGENVVTTSGTDTNNGYGDLFDGNGDPDKTYTQSFGGTSSAAAIVAGVVACLQGYVKASRGVPLLPKDIRDLLRKNANGTPQSNAPGNTAAAHRIGPLPDLCKLIPAA